MARDRFSAWALVVTTYALFFLVAPSWRLECLLLFALAAVTFRTATGWKARASWGDYIYVTIFALLILVNQFADGVFLTEDGKRVTDWLSSFDAVVVMALVGVVWFAAVMVGFHQFREHDAA